MNKSQLVAINTRYKKPALADLSYDFITNSLYDIKEGCADIRWAIDNDKDMLTSALDDDEEQVMELINIAIDIDGRADELISALNENFHYYDKRMFDDCSVALIGNRYKLIGFDSYEEDYFDLTSYESDLAISEAGKRVMRLNKAEMLSKIGQTLGIILSVNSLSLEYQNVNAVIEFLRNENLTLYKSVQKIDELYEEVICEYPANQKLLAFENYIKNLPDRVWIE